MLIVGITPPRYRYGILLLLRIAATAGQCGSAAHRLAAPQRIAKTPHHETAPAITPNYTQSGVIE